MYKIFPLLALVFFTSGAAVASTQEKVECPPAELYRQHMVNRDNALIAYQQGRVPPLHYKEQIFYTNYEAGGAPRKPPPASFEDYYNYLKDTAVEEKRDPCTYKRTIDPYFTWRNLYLTL